MCIKGKERDVKEKKIIRLSLGGEVIPSHNFRDVVHLIQSLVALRSEE